MRVMLACAAFPPFVKGGGAISSLLFAKSLARVGHEVRCLSVQGGRDRVEEYEGLAVRRLPSLNIYWNYYEPRPAWKKLVWHALENFNPRAYAVMRREIRQFRPDIVVTMSTENVNVATWVAARAENVAVAHCAQSFFLLCWRGSMFNKGTNCQRRCPQCVAASCGKKALSQLVHGFHAETDFILEVHRRHGYFANALTRKVLTAIDGVHEASRAPSDRLRIGYIGAHTPNKGLETLAAAAHQCIGQAVEFVIAGAGQPDYSNHIRSRFPAENTRFLGWVEPGAFYREIDVLVIPSVWQEPFGRVAVEAFSYGVPVIGTRTGGIPESIAEDVNGYLVVPGDAPGLAAIVQRLDRDRLERLSENARLAAPTYLQGNVGRALTRFYEETIAGRAA